MPHSKLHNFVFNEDCSFTDKFMKCLFISLVIPNGIGLLALISMLVKLVS